VVTPADAVALERAAIIAEAGDVTPRRADAIARCEGHRETARAHARRWRCVCGAHAAGLGEGADVG